ncbi:hypothetical protein ACTNEW_04425 [Blautia sp. HCP3S3_G3]
MSESNFQTRSGRGLV